MCHADVFGSRGTLVTSFVRTEWGPNSKGLKHVFLNAIYKKNQSACPIKAADKQHFEKICLLHISGQRLLIMKSQTLQLQLTQ